MTEAEDHSSGLSNVIECAPGIINGSAPHGDDGFESLVKMGVRTIISVDGFPPDVPKAEGYGMKYVQIPVGYEGVSGENILLLTRAVRDLPRPIYIHCFHGRERSPVAAALALAGTGELNSDEALDVLRRCGTSEKYTGLWEVVRSARRVPDEVLDALEVEFPQVATVDSLIGTMAQIGRVWDRMKIIEAAKWSVPGDHPDLQPRAETQRLHELFIALVSDGDVIRKDVAFREELGTALRTARLLSESLESRSQESAGDHMMALRASCNRCHEAYRDLPVVKCVGSTHAIPGR